MRTGTRLVLALLAVGLVCACGDSPGGGSNNNSFIPCEGIEDCPPGYECVSNVCVPSDDGGVPPDGSTDPDIEVTPTTLDFGNPLLNVAVQQSLTITNVGGADLTIFSILLEEDDARHEYDATPLGNLARVLAPGESVQVDVELVNTDEQADTGRLIINSNDLDEAMTSVPLVSELKGDGLVGTCVMETADFYSPCVTNPEIIDLGPLPSDASALQDVSLFNAGTGNTPLVVHDIYVTNNSGYVGQFHLTIVRFVEDPANPGSFLEETIPDLSTNPYLLEVNDGEGAPELLLIHVRFEATAALEGQPVPPEFLVIQTDDASHPNYQIPFAGDVLCPAGWVELDGVSPWCEYACTVTNGGVEGCDGVDNNCDGAIDEGCPVCGNGVVEAGETCDDGNGDNTDACPDGVGGTCQPAVCGDGHVQAGVEECDDGNGSNADACPDDVANGGNCEDAVCGDGFVHAGVEGCDDGNHSNTDACPDGVFGSCLPATCGDGFLQAGVEECDEGTANSDTAPDACRRTCVWAHCGDNVVDTGEMCDDGNNVSGDGCSADCSSNEVCGNSVVDPGELCDDGNQTNSDACPDGPFGTCEPAVCGDGFVHAGVEDCEPPSVGSCDANCMNAATLDPAGCFDIFPGPSQYCTFGLVNYTFSCVNFAVFGGTNLSVTANSGGGQPCVMNGTVDALGNFTATCTLYGGCDEIYTISGSFTSNNEWSGTFSASFVGSCYNCTNQSWSVVGQRRTTCPCP